MAIVVTAFFSLRRIASYSDLFATEIRSIALGQLIAQAAFPDKLNDVSEAVQILNPLILSIKQQQRRSNLELKLSGAKLG